MKRANDIICRMLIFRWPESLEYRSAALEGAVAHFHRNLYFKRFGKIRPNEIKTVRQVAAAQQAKKRAKKLAREQRREPPPFQPAQAGEGQGGARVQHKPARVATPALIDFEDVFIEFNGDRDIPF